MDESGRFKNNNVDQSSRTQLLSGLHEYIFRIKL